MPLGVVGVLDGQKMRLDWTEVDEAVVGLTGYLVFAGLEHPEFTVTDLFRSGRGRFPVIRTQRPGECMMDWNVACCEFHLTEMGYFAWLCRKAEKESV